MINNYVICKDNYDDNVLIKVKPAENKSCVIPVRTNICPLPARTTKSVVSKNVLI